MAKANGGRKAKVAADANGPAASGRQRNVLALRGTDEWKAWLDQFAASRGMPVTVFVDYALRELAKREGYAAPPQRV
jgi:hypothetical protein